MRKTVVAILLLTFFPLVFFAQELTFSKTVESTAMLSFRKQAWDPDGYWFFMDGTRIMKVDASGNKKWEKTVSTDPLLILQNIAYTGEHRFLVTAFHLTTELLHFFTLDQDGDLITSLTAPRQSSYGEHIIIGQDSLLVVGQRNTTGGQATGFADLFNTTTGSLLWSYMPAVSSLTHTGARRIDSGTIGLFGMQSGSVYGKAALTMIHTNGAEKWTKIYDGGPANVVCADVTLAPDNSLHALLRKGSASELITVSANGALQHTLSLPFTTGFYLIRNPHDGTFLVTGTTRDRIFFACVDEDSHVKWWRYYGSATRSEFGDAIHGVSHHHNHSFILWGASRHDNLSLPFLIRTDDEGNVQRNIPEAIREPQGTIRHLPGEASSGEPQMLTSARHTDGDLIVGGFYYKEIPGQPQPVPSALLSRLQENGDTLWTRDVPSMLGTSSYHTHFIADSEIMSTGNYVFLLQSRNVSNGFTVLCLDTNGKLLWNSTVMSGKRPDLVETAPGEILVCGHAFDLQRYNEMGVLHKIDLNTQSSTTLSVTLPGCMIHNIIASPKGTYYVTGEQIETYKISRKGYWAEINANGTVLASTTYDLAYKTMINATALTPGGDILCAGAVEDDKGNRDLLLMLINADGTRAWHRTYDILNQDEAVTVKVLADGYLVAGEIGKPVFGLQESFAYVARFSLQGDLQWQQLLGRPGYYSRSVALHLESDSTAILTGNSEKWNEGFPTFETLAFTEKITFNGTTVTGAEGETDERPEIYPNPFSENILVKCHEGCTVTLLTVQGQIISTFLVPPQTSPLPFDTYHLTEGLYIADIWNGHTHRRVRVVKN